jgi:hypothetical protein
MLNWVHERGSRPFYPQILGRIPAAPLIRQMDARVWAVMYTGSGQPLTQPPSNHFRPPCPAEERSIGSWRWNINYKRNLPSTPPPSTVLFQNSNRLNISAIQLQSLSLSLSIASEIFVTTRLERPPLWSSGQSSWLQIQISGLDSRRYQILWDAVGLERGPLSLVSTIEVLLGRKHSGSGL